MDELCQSAKSFITSGDPSRNEIEFRFTERGENFSVSLNTFQRILDSSKSNALWNVHSPVSTTVTIGKHIVKGNPDVRCIQNKTSTSYEIKKRIKIEDTHFKDYNIRASEANENEITLSDEDWAKTYLPILQRNRKRYSFTDKSKAWQLDLTEIESFTDVKLTTYEIELEYKSKSKLVSISNIKIIFTYILQEIQNSDVIISNLYGRQLIGDYCSLLKINPRYPKFVGPLPFTLTKEIFQSGKLSCGYSVTEKADGDRKLLFIGKKGICLLISRPKDKELQYQHVGTIPKLENSLFDGEFVNNKLYIFDTLIFMNNDLREHPLDHRLAVFKKFPSQTNCKIDIKFKTFYFSQEGSMVQIKDGIKTEIFENSDVYTMSEHIWKNKSKFDYSLDGLIYTPILANYYNTNIYKWKDSNTIDFFIIKLSETVWQLLIAGLNEQNEYVHIPFEGLNKDGLFKLRKGRNIETIINLIWKSDSPLKTGVINVSKTLSKKFDTNTVVEFKYYGGKLIPTRYRPDKKNANNIRAINDVWESISDSLTMSILKSGVYKSCTRQYHNSIKKYIIQKFSTEKKVLDIGSGAGGDIMKYSNARVKKLVGIDIVDVEYSHPSYMSFYKVNTELYSIKNTIQNASVGLFDTINCHFALHYFFKNQNTLDNLIKNLDENLKKGGLFIATCMDGEKIDKLLKREQITKGKTLNAKYKNTTIFKMKKNYKDVSDINDLPLVSQKIEVKLAGTKYFKDSSFEYIVNITKFIELMATNKYKMHQRISFAEMNKKFPYEIQAMNNVEKEFSFLNSFIVFIKE